MKELIESFIADVFSNEYIDNVRKAFSLFEAFSHDNAYAGMADAINDEGVEGLENRADRFTAALKKELDYVVGQHLIELTDEATIADRLLILDALYRLQHLECYIPYESILSSDDDAIDKMSRILEELTTTDQGYFLTLLHSVDDFSIEQLQKFIEAKPTKEEPPIKKEIIERLKIVAQVLGHETIGFAMISGGMKPGYDVSLYLPYVEDHVVVEGNNEQTVKNILSVLYMSEIDESGLLNLYRDVGERVFKSVDLVGRLESQVISLISKVQEARKIHDEKARVLQESAASKSGR